MNEELAVFPLHTVLFPGCTLALRIFEQRYLRMISESMRDGEPFVISLIRDNSSEVGEASECFQTGTLAKIIDFNQSSQGVLDIIVEGEARVALSDFRHEEDFLLKAKVSELSEDEIVEMPTHYLFLEKILLSLKNSHPEILAKTPDKLSATQTSFLLSYVAPASTRRKQKLLESTDTLERLSQLQMIFSETKTTFLA